VAFKIKQGPHRAACDSHADRSRRRRGGLTGVGAPAAHLVERDDIRAGVGVWTRTAELPVA
jgi:hypothetical protein